MTVKDRLRILLENNPCIFYSGEDLGERLGCSRNAIWKAVNSLKDEGYMIESVNGKGYALSQYSDVLSETMIKSYLGDNDFNVEVFDEIDSTNTELKKQAVAEKALEKTVIVSDFQSGGRGRRGRSFFSPKGSGLYLSMLLRPDGSVIDNLILTAQASVAVYKAVKEQCLKELSIKWVNDLYLNGKKVCGILSEGQTSLESGKLDFVIVGIGLNIYDPEDGFPSDIDKIAGSIMGSKSPNNHIDRNKLSASIIKNFYKLAEKQDLDSIYKEKNMVPGKYITVIDGKNHYRAYAKGITNTGRLIIEYDGKTEELVYGEVSVRPDRDI